MNLKDIASGLKRTDLTYLREMDKSHDEAQIIKIVPEKGTHVYLILDRTIFHPKGGGQPSDRGNICSTNFELNVKKALYYQGVVIHWAKIISGEPLIGPATCVIDWPFRQLVMRRHTAAHLLDHCLALETSRRVETTDSWLDEPCYVGYAGNVPNEDVLRRVETHANRMVSQGGDVKIDYLTVEQGRALLRAAPNFERLPELDEIRTVTITGCAPIPCGGTHVADISQIGRISIIRAEPMPNFTFRLHFSV
ncbi:MAG: alanyl-tRNA editing protein [Candidatus Bathyarchaeia archaeon]